VANSRCGNRPRACRARGLSSSAAAPGWPSAPPRGPGLRWRLAA